MACSIFQAQIISLFKRFYLEIKKISWQICLLLLESAKDDCTCTSRHDDRELSVKSRD
jgi:hypothetical protein